ncbi:MAG: GNAT family N-acetyltransferase [Maritimibacter sp.]
MSALLTEILKIWNSNRPSDPAHIGSYVRSEMAGRGIGRQLFARSSEAARTAGLIAIDATIADDNAPGLAYYDAMGFETYRTKPGAICKAYRLNTSPV